MPATAYKAASCGIVISVPAATSDPCGCGGAVPAAAAACGLAQAMVSMGHPSAAFEHGSGIAVSSLSGAATSVDSSQVVISTEGLPAVDAKPGVGTTSLCPVVLGVYVVWMEAFRQLCFLVPSIALDTCAHTKRWDLSKLLNSHLSFHLLVFITFMFDAAPSLHVGDHEILGATPECLVSHTKLMFWRRRQEFKIEVKVSKN